MVGGADQDMSDNHLYAALLDNGPDDAFDKDKAYRDVDAGQGNDNCDAYEQNINIIDCQDVRPDQMVFVKITKVDIVSYSKGGECLNYTPNKVSDCRENKT